MLRHGRPKCRVAWDSSAQSDKRAGPRKVSTLRNRELGGETDAPPGSDRFFIQFGLAAWLFSMVLGIFYYARELKGVAAAFERGPDDPRCGCGSPASTGSASSTASFCSPLCSSCLRSPGFSPAETRGPNDRPNARVKSLERAANHSIMR